MDKSAATDSAQANGDEEEDEELSKELTEAFKFLEPKKFTDEKAAAEYNDEEDAPHFKLKHYEKKDETKDTPRLLEPNHPLLEKFQKALKEHLHKQINKLNEEIFELETGAKKKNQNREQVGVEAYELQQAVCKQQNNIEHFADELETVVAARLEVEAELEDAEKLHKDEQQCVSETESKELELRKEVKSMDLLLHQMSTWAKDMESELLVNQRMSEKTRKEKIKLADEKRQLDIIIYKLMTETWRLENELETMDLQMRAKEKDRERLAEAVVQTNIDIEALESEQRCLLHSWHSVIIAIGNRDKHYNSVYHDYQKNNERIQEIITEINQVKKLCKLEMMQNEHLTMFKSRIINDIRNCEHQLDTESRKKNQIEHEMNQTATIIERIESDIKNLDLEMGHTRRELDTISRELDQLCTEKMKLEEQILLKLQDQITNDKASIYLKKIVEQGKQKNIDIELALGGTENQNAKVIDLIERQKDANLDLSAKVRDYEIENLAMHEEMKYVDDEMNKCKTSIKKRQQNCEILNKKYERLLTDRTASMLCPEEMKVRVLEKNISETVENNKSFQKFWLREQGHICQLSEQRQEQIKELNLIKKQTTILEQRNLKISDELEACVRKETELNRSVDNLYKKVSLLNEQFFKKKGNANFLTETNNLQQVDYVSKLKDLELETLGLEDDLEDMENDKVRLSDDLIEKNRERLAWEKKYKMALETKENLKQDQEGELNDMKAEIHRMNVRYGQLKRVQEKLINDMEHCVLRRDTIFTVAEAREKRHKEGTACSRVNVLRKLDDLRNKYKHAEMEHDNVVKKLGNVKEQEANLEDDYAHLEKEIKDVEDELLRFGEKIENCKTQKQLNLEVLILRQQKLKTFSKLIQGAKPSLLFRTESALIAEFSKQRDINYKLLGIVEFLLTSYPQQNMQLNRIFNTLKLPSIVV